jgi:hypothetical protein
LRTAYPAIARKDAVRKLLMCLIAFAVISPALADGVTGCLLPMLAAQADFKRLSLIENAAWPRSLTSQFFGSVAWPMKPA